MTTLLALAPGEVLTFDRFQPGELIGADTVVLDQGLLDLWRRLCADESIDASQIPCGLISVLIMRVYKRVFPPRPPGNIHAMQSFELHQPLRRDEQVRISIGCKHKELKKDRRFVDLETVGESQRGVLFKGVMTFIWAR